MRCAYCGSREDKVIDSRSIQEDGVIRRRRQCLRCGKRFTTYEYVEELQLMVIKRDGRRQPFDRKKVLAGIIKACEKRPISVEKMEEIAQEVERQVLKKHEREVASTKIGELVMEKLKFTDDVAYVRFASVYRQFKDVEQFISELKDLIGREEKAGARKPRKKQGRK
ncbi:MAG: transcriptional regulator NrdR [Deltaproteobacteria bacterium]